MRAYTLNCEILTPIHIGTGEEYEPLEYVIDYENSPPMFYHIDTERFVMSVMNDETRQRFQDFVDSENLNLLRRFLHDEFLNLSPEEKSDCTIAKIPVSSTIAKRYKENLKNPNSQNQLLVHPFIRTKRINRAYIPGSSLKGAIRTAVVDGIAHAIERNEAKPIWDSRLAKEFEAKVLGYGRDIRKDPFRTIKLRDANLSKNATEIAEVLNAFYAEREQRIMTKSMQMFTEITTSRISGKETFFTSELLIDDKLQNIKNLFADRISAKQIAEDCNYFYMVELDREIEFYEREHNSIIAKKLKKISNEMEKYQDSEDTFLLRVGRFSGVFAITLEDYRNPKPPGGKGWGNTRNLAKGKYPLGWVKVEMEELK